MLYLFVPMFGLYMFGILLCRWVPEREHIKRRRTDRRQRGNRRVKRSIDCVRTLCPARSNESELEQPIWDVPRNDQFLIRCGSAIGPASWVTDLMVLHCHEHHHFGTASRPASGKEGDCHLAAFRESPWPRSCFTAPGYGPGSGSGLSWRTFRDFFDAANEFSLAAHVAVSSGIATGSTLQAPDGPSTASPLAGPGSPSSARRRRSRSRASPW